MSYRDELWIANGGLHVQAISNILLVASAGRSLRLK